MFAHFAQGFITRSTSGPPAGWSTDGRQRRFSGWMKMQEPTGTSDIDCSSVGGLTFITELGFSLEFFRCLTTKLEFLETLFTVFHLVTAVQ